MVSDASFSYEDSSLLVHDLLCGTNPYTTISRKLIQLLERFLRNLPKESLHQQFQKRCIPFACLEPSEQSFLSQLVVFLGLDCVVDQMSSVVLTWESFDGISWTHFLALVSTVIIATKGGVSAIKALIHRILTRVFQTSLGSNNSGTTDMVDAALMDLDAAESTDEDREKSNSVGGELSAFMLALLLARQLTVEDTRLTGFSYSQWWSETFGSDSQDCILRSRADVILLSSLLLELLPLEFDPRLLQVQITSKPMHSGLGQVKKVMNKQKGNPTNQSTYPDEGLATSLPNQLDLLDALTELDSLDAAYTESCVQRWNDYVEVGRGRLAELRELHQQEPEPLVNPLASNQVSTTPGWEEVLGWITEMIKQPADGRAQRLPHGLTEAVLFRPRQLRTNLIPALLRAVEIDQLSDELREARTRLITNMKQAGLGHLLLEGTSCTEPTKPAEQQQRSRGTSAKRPSATLLTRGKRQRKL